MAEINITKQLINKYRALICNYVLSDSAISEMIKKDIETGKLPKEFATLATDAKKAGYNAGSSNFFGYGFNTDNIMGLSFERTISPEELEHRKNKQMANNIVENLLKNTSGWNDLDAIKAEIKKINNPEIYELVNKALEEKGYKSDTFYSPMEKFLSEENNHFMRDSSDLNMIWELFENGALTKDEKNNINLRCVLREIADGEPDLEYIKKILNYIDYNDPKVCEKINDALEVSSSENDVFLTDLRDLLLTNKNKVSYTIILDSAQKRIERTSGLLSLLNNDLSNNLDGKVDADFAQGYVGDCWLIAAVKGIISNDITRAILEKECLKADGNGNCIVKLLGVGKEYTITQEELKANAYFSSGDDDVRAIEIAFEKFFIENKGYHGWYKKEGITGGYESDACKILLGDAVSIKENIDDYTFTDDKIDELNSKNLICFVSAHGEDKGNFMLEFKTIVPRHAYYFAKADSENVYLVNPWDTSEKIKISRKTFKEFFNSIELLEVRKS